MWADPAYRTAIRAEFGFHSAHDLIISKRLGNFMVTACQSGKREQQRGWEQIFHGGFLRWMD